jgi:hypothetical protein
MKIRLLCFNPGGENTPFLPQLNGRLVKYPLLTIVIPLLDLAQKLPLKFADKILYLFPPKISISLVSLR